ncbi:MAG TPA: alpha/beta hydrolase, partial [Polyangiaceae bacterium]|nr:alpha/beta hydrolase [Polyangiaceae bacterium]
QFMQERIPDSRLAVIEGAGHMPNLERPAEFNTALRGFLDEVTVPEERIQPSKRTPANPR